MLSKKRDLFFMCVLLFFFAIFPTKKMLPFSLRSLSSSSSSLSLFSSTSKCLFTTQQNFHNIEPLAKTTPFFLFNNLSSSSPSSHPTQLAPSSLISSHWSSFNKVEHSLPSYFDNSDDMQNQIVPSFLLEDCWDNAQIDPEKGEEFDMFLLKRTYQPNIRKRKRTHGFLKRNSTPSGRKIIRNRIDKGRKYIAV